MACDAAALPFQAQANWSIDFDISLTYTIEGIIQDCTLKSTVF